MEILSGLTTSIDKLFEAFLTEMLWFFIFSSGIMAILLTKFKNEIDRKVTGIARIHRKGKDVRNLLRALNNSQEICILGFVPYGLVFDNRELLTKKLRMVAKLTCYFVSIIPLYCKNYPKSTTAQTLILPIKSNQC